MEALVLQRTGPQGASEFAAAMRAATPYLEQASEFPLAKRVAITFLKLEKLQEELLSFSEKRDAVFLVAIRSGHSGKFGCFGGRRVTSAHDAARAAASDIYYRARRAL
jgi:hypothetical protein